MTAPVGRRRPGPRRALAEDEILDAALSLLDDGGAAVASALTTGSGQRPSDSAARISRLASR